MKTVIQLLQRTLEATITAEQNYRHGDHSTAANVMTSQAAELQRAIPLLKAYAGQCECGMVEPGFNAAIHDLGHNLAVHRDFLAAFQGTPKGDYHARCIADIEAALAKLAA